MSIARRTFVVPALLSATLATSLGAQQSAASCSIDQTKPGQLGRAFLAVQTAANLQAQKPADAAKQLQAAVKVLTENADKINNSKGRDLMLGKALGLWLMQPDQAPVATRGQLGFATSPEATIDLVVAIDSLLTPLEKAEAGCIQETAPYRAGKPWISLVNASIEHLNADRMDSAAASARRAVMLYPSAPYPYMVLGNVTQRTNVDAAIEHYRAGLAVATDTIYVEAKRSMLQAMGSVAAETVDSASSAATKQKYAAVATQAYEQLMKEFPTSKEGVLARTGVARLRLASGDTAGFRATYADQIANPGNYSYLDLLNPAVAAAKANQHADAAKLFEGALQQNPFNRDALFNAALMYHEQGQFDKMPAFIKRLTAVDPSNPDNWRLYAHAYAGMARALRPASATRPAAGARAGVRPAASPARLSPAVEAQIRALNDSTVKYVEMAEKMPVKVEFSEWTNTAEKSTIAGTIENKGSAAKAYTMTVEFLDKAGNAVDTQTASVASVAPNGRGRFSLTTQNKDVVAFRYKPLS